MMGCHSNQVLHKHGKNATGILNDPNLDSSLRPAILLTMAGQADIFTKNLPLPDVYSVAQGKYQSSKKRWIP